MLLLHCGLTNTYCVRSELVLPSTISLYVNCYSRSIHFALVGSSSSSDSMFLFSRSHVARSVTELMNAPHTLHQVRKPRHEEVHIMRIHCMNA